MSLAHSELRPPADRTASDLGQDTRVTEPVAEYDPLKDPGTIARLVMASISMSGRDFVKRTNSTRLA